MNIGHRFCSLVYPLNNDQPYLQFTLSTFLAFGSFSTCLGVRGVSLIFQLIEYGAIFHQGSYFRDTWNCIDALVVSCAIASLVLRLANYT